MTILLSVGGLSRGLLGRILGKTTNYSLEDQIVFAKNAGFDGIDYIATISDIFLKPSAILKLAKKHNVKVKAVHIPLLFVFFFPSIFYKKINRLLSYFPESGKFNFHLSGFLTPLSRSNRNLKKFQELANKSNFQISAESNPNEYKILNMYPKPTWDPQQFAEFCNKNNVPMNLDTSHIASWNYDIVKFFKEYHRNISTLHLSDMTSKEQHLTFGKGILPLNELFIELKKKNYRGTIIFEIFNFPKNTSKKTMQIEITHNLKLFKKALI